MEKLIIECHALDMYSRMPQVIKDSKDRLHVLLHRGQSSALIRPTESEAAGAAGEDHAFQQVSGTEIYCKIRWQNETEDSIGQCGVFWDVVVAVRKALSDLNNKGVFNAHA